MTLSRYVSDKLQTFFMKKKGHELVAKHWDWFQNDFQYFVTWPDGVSTWTYRARKEAKRFKSYEEAKAFFGPNYNLSYELEEVPSLEYFEL